MNGPLPSLHGLRAFEAAARLQSFTKAAEELGVTQTAVSHLIRRLEDELGTKLFRREGRQIRLTSEGDRLYPGIHAAFDDMRRATERFRRQPGNRRLTLSTTPGFAVKWLVPRLQGFRDKHPGVDVRIGTGMDLVDFRRDEVDVAVRFGKGTWPGLRADFLMGDNLFPVCAPRLANGNPPLHRPEDLARHTQIIVGSLQDDWQLWFTGAGIAPVRGRNQISFDMVLTAIEAAVDGLGVMLGRERLLVEELATGRLIVPFEARIPSTIGYHLVSPLELADRPLVRAFRDWILEAAREQPNIDPRA
ncbi:transcriptional regulator GcvA [Desertibaculum subflavum]|uniref:transcriptional regulator GcvA n=1 Tax=Desertibaculum subflavum TaxID=2268458 RepID=UPI000E662828